jgi:hypothetical protein
MQYEFNLVQTYGQLCTSVLSLHFENGHLYITFLCKFIKITIRVLETKIGVFLTQIWKTP